MMKRPWEWKQLLPTFLEKLAGLNEEEREGVLKGLITTALRELSDEEYMEFVEKVAVSLASLPEWVRYTILTSSIVNPKGLSPEDSKKAIDALAGMIRKSIVENSSNRDLIIRTILESALMMDYDDAAEVVSGIVNSSMRLGAIDYMKYTAAWLNVLGDMDDESIRRVLGLRNSALKGFQQKVIDDKKVLVMAAMLLISSRKRKLIAKIIESIE